VYVEKWKNEKNNKLENLGSFEHPSLLEFILPNFSSMFEFHPYFCLLSTKSFAAKSALFSEKCPFSHIFGDENKNKEFLQPYENQNLNKKRSKNLPSMYLEKNYLMCGFCPGSMVCI
jgi:hypothetical protein